MSAHTPGPWKPVGAGSIETDDYLERWVGVANVVLDSGHADLKQQRANGLLMAAAPALADALESIRIRCREGDKFTDWLPIIDGIAETALRQAGRFP